MMLQESQTFLIFSQETEMEDFGDKKIIEFPKNAFIRMHIIFLQT